MSEGEKKRGLLGGLTARATRLAADAARAALTGAGEAERLALTILKDRMDRLDYPAPIARYEPPPQGDDARDAGASRSERAPVIAVMPSQPRTAAERLRDLLAQSTEQTDAEAWERLDAQILGQLVPDEARMLATLAEGASFPVVQVQRVAALARSGAVVLDHHSNLAKKSGVTLPAQGARYLLRLKAAGLIEEGSDDASQKLAYELLESEELVRNAVAEIGTRFGERARLVRSTVKLNAAGRGLWERCMRPTTIEQASNTATADALPHLP